MSQDEMTDEVKDYISSDDFKKVLDEAVPEKLKIVNDVNPEIKEIKGEFIEYMLKSAGVADNEKKDAAKKFAKIFKKVSDFTFFKGGWPKADSIGKLEALAENVAIALKFLDFMQIKDFRDCLAKHGIYIDDKKTKTLKDDYPSINEGSWENMLSMFDDNKNCQTKICESVDKIEKTIFEEEIPDEVKFSKENKCGLKKGSFNKIIAAEVAKKTKTKEKAESYMTTLTENIIFNVERENILKDHLTNMLENT